MEQNVTPQWQTASFDELSSRQLYAIMKLRQEVFVIEQTSIYVDADGLDLEAMHICLWQDGELLAYERCLPPGLQEYGFNLSRGLSCTVSADPLSASYALYDLGQDYRVTFCQVSRSIQG